MCPVVTSVALCLNLWTCSGKKFGLQTDCTSGSSVLPVGMLILDSIEFVENKLNMVKVQQYNEFYSVTEE